MLRLSLIEAALFLLPFVLYGLYLAVRPATDPAEQRRRVSFLNLCLVGLGLVVAGFLLFGFEAGEGRKGTYHPAEVRDGVLVPSHIE